MKTDENEERIALQPETQLEQDLLGVLHTALEDELPCHYTLDVPEYEDLDEDLWEYADCPATEEAGLQPEPGSRALVIIHSQPYQERDLSAE